MSIRQGNSIIAQGAINNTLYVSNCITEIPQDIKLELNNGTLTLKAGSKVYVPNGAGVFDVITIATDQTLTYISNSQRFVLVKTDGTIHIGQPVSSSVSGTTDSLSNVWHTWYDTGNNLVKTFNNTNVLQYTTSLPIAIVTISNNKISSIDQVFNGFGYIGSTVFALPGVKGLIPNGRNADGTLKNINMNITSVQTVQTAYYDNVNWVGHLTGQNGSIGQVVSDHYFEQPKEPTGVTGWTVWYNTNDNIIYLRCIGSGDSDDKWVVTQDLIAFHWSTNSDTRITSFKSKTAFRAVDYNDTEYIAHQAMPSSRYDSLTLGASGTTYTAPADGWFVVLKAAGTSGAYFNLVNTTAKIGVTSDGMATGAKYIYVPASKGDAIQVNYSFSGTTSSFTFVYANGAS